jgi:hypothetical protein
LGHVGTSAATLTPQNLGSGAHQTDRVEARGQILGDADHDCRLALIAGDNRDNTRADAPL